MSRPGAVEVHHGVVQLLTHNSCNHFSQCEIVNFLRTNQVKLWAGCSSNFSYTG